MTETDPLIQELDWIQPVEQACSVRKAFGFAIVTWLSGRRTLEMYSGCAVMADLERAMNHRQNLRRLYEAQLRSTMRWFRIRTHPPGWWIRWGAPGRSRTHARAVRAVAYLHPDSYQGPTPGPGDVISG